MAVGDPDKASLPPYRPPPWVRAMRFRLSAYVIYLVGVTLFFSFLFRDPWWAAGVTMVATGAIVSTLSTIGHGFKAFSKCPACGENYNLTRKPLHYPGVWRSSDFRPDRSRCRDCGYRWLDHREKVLSAETRKARLRLPDLLNEKYRHMLGAALGAYVLPALVGAYWTGLIGLFGVAVALAFLMCAMAWLWGTADRINQIDRDLDGDIE